MAVRVSSPGKQPIHESPKKRGESHHCDVSLKNTKETLLEALEGVENEIKKLGKESLRNQLENLRGQVRGLLENQEKEINNLRDEIKSLRKEVESQKAKNERLEKAFAVAQATWMWEAHLARFVVDSSQEIGQIGRFHQMQDYLEEKNTTTNPWTEIQGKLTRWTKDHWTVVKNVRRERNSMAHPDLIDLDYIESELIKMSQKYQTRMRDMLDILKMTASLMKFGRLAKRSKHLLRNKQVQSKGMETRAMNDILSWDRNFDEIGGLLNIGHEEAKIHLKKYIDNPRMIDHYLVVVNSIKDTNSKRLGKLAWKIEGLAILGGKSEEYGEALDELKKLVPNPDNKNEPTDLDKAIVKLHIPDFLPKRLWKHGIEIVEKYFERPSKT